jgi:hypothetical protein
VTGVDGKRPERSAAGPKKRRGQARAGRSSPASSLQGRRRGMTIFAASVRKLVGENVHATDFRLLDEQLGRSGHQLLLKQKCAYTRAIIDKYQCAIEFVNQ